MIKYENFIIESRYQMKDIDKKFYVFKIDKCYYLIEIVKYMPSTSEFMTKSIFYRVIKPLDVINIFEYPIKHNYAGRFRLTNSVTFNKWKREKRYIVFSTNDKQEALDYYDSKELKNLELDPYGEEDWGYVGEAKVSEIEVGTRVLFRGKFKRGCSYLDLDGATGTVGKVTKIYYQKNYEIILDEPKGLFKKINISSYQIRNLTVIDDKNDELSNKLKSGELSKFKSTKALLTIFKEMKFKKKGDYFDATYFDIVKDNPDYISYIPSKKSLGEDIEKFRQQTRVGRVLRKLNPDLTDKEIEDFVDMYRASYENYIKGPNIEVVTGNDITYWYNSKQYAPGGTLNNSCMRNSTAPSFYAKFPDRIAMAIITKNGKLLGRALIWKLDDGRIYMDRIYSVNGTVSAQIRKYGQDNKMIIRGSIAQKLKVTLKKDSSPRSLPYRDTFCYSKFNNNNKEFILSNYQIK